MDYTRLKSIARDKNKSLKQLAADIGMTEAGFFSAIRKDTLSIAKLELCAKALNVDINLFFKDENDNLVSEPPADYSFQKKYYNLLEKYNEKLEEVMELRRELNQARIKNK